MITGLGMQLFGRSFFSVHKVLGLVASNTHKQMWQSSTLEVAAGGTNVQDRSWQQSEVQPTQAPSQQ